MQLARVSQVFPGKDEKPRLSNKSSEENNRTRGNNLAHCVGLCRVQSTFTLLISFAAHRNPVRFERSGYYYDGDFILFYAILQLGKLELTGVKLPSPDPEW